MKKQANTVRSIGSRIREARDKADYSQLQLAEKLGFESATAISLIENGERGVSAEMLSHISEVLKVELHVLLGKTAKAPDVIVALRADKDISDDDRAAIERFVEMAKSKSHASKRKRT